MLTLLRRITEIWHLIRDSISDWLGLIYWLRRRFAVTHFFLVSAGVWIFRYGSCICLFASERDEANVTGQCFELLNTVLQFDSVRFWARHLFRHLDQDRDEWSVWYLTYWTMSLWLVYLVYFSAVPAHLLWSHSLQHTRALWSALVCFGLCRFWKQILHKVV